jgi:DNA repair protein RecN (Recombination protein N)
MLIGLSIRDILLIDRLDLAFQPGLTVLTGETGAGKSILLDSVGLALGARSESGLVRPGANGLSVTAEFQLEADHPVFDLLRENDISPALSLLLRRVISVDGRSRAFIDDQPVSVGLLRRVGDALVEIHGQFANIGLLDSATHRTVLDQFAGLSLTALRLAWRDWRAATSSLLAAQESSRRAEGQQEYLRAAVDDLLTLAPQPDEENALLGRRTLLMHGEKLLEGMNAALDSLNRHGGVSSMLRTAERALQRVADKAEGRLDAVIAALDRSAIEAEEAQALLDKASSSVELDSGALESVEERLFALRSAARKHAVATAELPALLTRLQQELSELEGGGEGLQRLQAAERAAGEAYREQAEKLSAARRAAATQLDQQVAAELPPLRLDRARFHTRLELLPETGWGEHGVDQVAFEVTTNPGMPPGPLAKVASGGELSRFMLALKLVLAGSSSVPTIIFDEVDSGIGGAVAAAVGDRLGRLAQRLQLLVVTHSPQVAAVGGHHWQVAKQDNGAGGWVTRIHPLVPSQRREEVARMLSGAEVTAEARAAADRLLAAGGMLDT